MRIFLESTGEEWEYPFEALGHQVVDARGYYFCSVDRNEMAGLVAELLNEAITQRKAEEWNGLTPNPMATPSSWRSRAGLGDIIDIRRDL